MWWEFFSIWTSLPYTVEYFPIGEDSNVHVRDNDVVKMSCLLVLEKGIWHPYFVRISHGEVLQPTLTILFISECSFIDVKRNKIIVIVIE